MPQQQRAVLLISDRYSLSGFFAIILREVFTTIVEVDADTEWQSTLPLHPFNLIFLDCGALDRVIEQIQSNPLLNPLPIATSLPFRIRNTKYQEAVSLEVPFPMGSEVLYSLLEHLLENQ